MLKSFCEHNNETIFLNVSALEDTRRHICSADSRPHQNTRLLRSEHVSLLANLVVLQQCDNTCENECKHYEFQIV